jgi:hypothetical protein
LTDTDSDIKLGGFLEKLDDFGGAVDTVRTIKKLEEALKPLDDIEDLDPEDDADAEKTREILDLTLDALDKITTDIVDGDTGIADEKSRSALDFVKGLIKVLIKYHFESASPEKMGFETYPAHPEFPTVSLAGLPKMADQPPPRTMIFKPKKIAQLLRRIIRYTVGVKLIGNKPQELEDAGKSEEALKALFSRTHLTKLELIPNPRQYVPEPDHMDSWENDDFQGRQFLNGVNPVMIKVAQDLGNFSEEIANELGKDTLQGLIDDKRLFYVSFDELEDLEENPHQARPAILNPGIPQDEPRYFDAAIAVFVLSEDRQTIKPEAIQLVREPGARVYTKANSGESEWLFAKTKLQTADSQYHEWVSHLGMTHLVTEPHIVAVYNTLERKSHKLYTFFKPLFEDTLLLNWLARKSLAKPGPDAVGDVISSVGIGQYMQVIQKKYQSYDFFESGLPSELASRGFIEDFDMPMYLFRTDGMKLWDAYGTFASDFVAELYESDEELANDEVVQEWAKETSYADKGAVPGFPTSFTDRATLVKALQTIMWVTSGLHAAVNFPQYDFLAWGPNKPLGGRASIDDFPSDASEEEQRSWIFKEFMPDLETQAQVVSIVDVLTTPSFKTINVMDETFETIGAGSYAKFKKVLEGIGDGINERNKINKKKGLPVYDYLHPDVVSASIDI